jgi:hypothetical protein
MTITMMRSVVVSICNSYSAAFCNGRADAALTPLISMMIKLEAARPVLCRGLMAYRCYSLAIKPLSAPLPSLCHATPCGSVLRSAGKFGHALALSGMFQKFLRGINRHVFRLERITNPDVTPKVPSNSAHRENWRSISASTEQ